VDNLRSPELQALEMLVVEQRWGLRGQIQGILGLPCLFGWGGWSVKCARGAGMTPWVGESGESGGD
jgi:hypothetical protein